MDEETAKRAFSTAKALSGVEASFSIVPESIVKDKFRDATDCNVKFYSKPSKNAAFMNGSVLESLFSEDSAIYAFLHELSHIKNHDRGFSIKSEQRCFREAYEWLAEGCGETEALGIVDRHIEEFSYLYKEKKHPFFENQVDYYLPFLKNRLPSYGENSFPRKLKKALKRSF